MGRHSGPPATPPVPLEPEPTPLPTPGPAPEHRLQDHLVLAGAAALGTGAVMAWAGANLTAAVLGAAGSAVVVLVAARVAGSVSGRPNDPGTTNPPQDAP